VDQRSETAKHKILCFNCLGTDHSVYFCPSKKSCRKCNRCHNSLLNKYPSNHSTITTTSCTLGLTSASRNNERSTRVMRKDNRNNCPVHTALASITSEKMSYSWIIWLTVVQKLRLSADALLISSKWRCTSTTQSLPWGESSLWCRAWCLTWCWLVFESIRP